MVTAVPFVTSHAIEHYQDRVDSRVSRREVLRAIREILARANRRSRPRHWTTVDARPGCWYRHSADQPDICPVLRGRAVVTVYLRASYSAWCPSPDGATASWPPAPYHRRTDITEFCEAG
jgi:hypothetical protein